MRRRLALWLLRDDLRLREAYALRAQEGFKDFAKGRQGRVFWNGYLRALQALQENGL
jgi:hypothetical protein